MKRTVKQIVALTLALMLCVLVLPFTDAGKASADNIYGKFSIADDLRGLVNGKVFLGSTLIYNVNEVIQKNPELKAAYDICDLVYSQVYLTDTTGGDQIGGSYDDLGRVTISIPATPTTDNPTIRNGTVVGKNVCINVVFKIGADYHWFYSENFRVYGDLTKVKLPALPNKTYTGKPLTQSLNTLVFDQTSGYKLTEGQDYTVSYRNNLNAGTATVTVTGNGYFVGQISGTFKINKAANPLKVKGKTATVKYTVLQKKNVTLKKAAVLSVTKAQGKVTFKKLSGVKKISINKTTGKVTVMKGLSKGTYKVKVQVNAAGNKNYLPGSKTATITIKVK